MRLLLGSLCLSLCSPCLAAAQSPMDSVCVASLASFSESPGRDLWPDEAWQSRQDTAARPTTYVAAQLAGTYRVFQVESEGGGPMKGVRLFRMWLTVPPADSAAGWTRGFNELTSVPLAGTQTLLFAGLLGDEPLAEVVGAEEPIYLLYRKPDGLTLTTDPVRTIDGMGYRYNIAGVKADGSFDGRWVSGGNSFAVYSKAGVAESSGGYYCAVRE